jgi:microcin C transport system substrate-binding protein
MGLAAAKAQQPAAPSAEQKRHTALWLVSPPEFDARKGHFDWVNPKAPKGGTANIWSAGSFDTLNPFTVRGDSPFRLVQLTYDTIMASNPNEPSTEYCLLCTWVSYPDDYSSVTFKLRPEARFHDGKPITTDDVIFSFEALQKGLPFYRHYYKNVARVERQGDHQLTFHFNVKNNRELPQIMGQLYVMPKHYWEGKDSTGKQRDISKPTLEIPLTSGPYRVKSIVATKEVIYERVKDWWAKDLPIMRGQWNFDTVRLTYFRDRTPAFEAFKTGAIDYWEETSATAWATQFDFNAVKRGHVKQEQVPLSKVAWMVGFIMNTRRAKFQDARVRQAINLAFDFEFTNRTLFYGQYQRLTSYFDNSELAARGRPEGKELEILNEVRDLVSPEVFGPVWSPPVNGSREAMRGNLDKAAKLLDEAGWRLDGPQADCGFLCAMMVKVGLSNRSTIRVRRNARGEPLRMEFLLNASSKGTERIVLPFIANLKRLGIDATARAVDTAQLIQRARTFEFDVFTGQFPQSNSPGNEQRGFFGSASANQTGSRNFAGITNPAIDKIIERLIMAKDRAELVAATRALDRVLQWNFYVVPQWYLAADRLAYWVKFARPDKHPTNDTAFLSTWWIDPEGEARMKAALGR